MEKKLTDEEIVKALEVCVIEVEIHDKDDCKECPYFIKKIDCVTGKRSEKDYLELIKRQKAEIERLTEERDKYQEKWQTAYMNELNLQKQVDELKEENGQLVTIGNGFALERNNLREELDELTKENERLKKFEMHRIKAMKKDKDEIERLTADLISMDREQECYIATIKDLNKQIDEFVKIARVSDTKKLVDEIKQQAVKDTANKIFRQVLKLYQGLSKGERETMTFEWKLLDLAVEYGVEVE